jgi:hypothetical protein
MLVINTLYIFIEENNNANTAAWLSRYQWNYTVELLVPLISNFPAPSIIKKLKLLTLTIVHFNFATNLTLMHFNIWPHLQSICKIITSTLPTQLFNFNIKRGLSAPTVILKTGVCVSLQINNVELGYEIYTPLESWWHAIRQNINFYFIYWWMPVILVDSNMHLSGIGSTIFCGSLLVTQSQGHLTGACFHIHWKAHIHWYISVDDENNKMLPGDKMDHTEIGISTIRRHTRDMLMVQVQDEKVKLWLWTNTCGGKYENRN